MQNNENWMFMSTDISKWLQKQDDGNICLCFRLKRCWVDWFPVWKYILVLICFPVLISYLHLACSCASSPRSASQWTCRPSPRQSNSCSCLTASALLSLHSHACSLSIVLKIHALLMDVDTEVISLKSNFILFHNSSPSHNPSLFKHLQHPFLSLTSSIKDQNLCILIGIILAHLIHRAIKVLSIISKQDSSLWKCLWVALWRSGADDIGPEQWSVICPKRVTLAQVSRSESSCLSVWRGPPAPSTDHCAPAGGVFGESLSPGRS